MEDDSLEGLDRELLAKTLACDGITMSWRRLALMLTSTRDGLNCVPSIQCGSPDLQHLRM